MVRLEICPAQDWCWGTLPRAAAAAALLGYSPSASFGALAGRTSLSRGWRGCVPVHSFPGCLPRLTLGVGPDRVRSRYVWPHAHLCILCHLLFTSWTWPIAVNPVKLAYDPCDFVSEHEQPKNHPNHLLCLASPLYAICSRGGGFHQCHRRVPAALCACPVAPWLHGGRHCGRAWV